MSTDSGSVFVRSAQGDGPTLLLLHGYPSSSYDYRMVVPHLAGRGWLTLDFLGFGLSDKPRPHRYSLLEQADIVQTVVAEETTSPVVIIAHDMGTSVTTELIAPDLDGRLPFELQRVVLTNGSVILARASLRPIQKVLRGPPQTLSSFPASGTIRRWRFRTCSPAPHAACCRSRDQRFWLKSTRGFGDSPGMLRSTT